MKRIDKVMISGYFFLEILAFQWYYIQRKIIYCTKSNNKEKSRTFLTGENWSCWKKFFCYFFVHFTESLKRNNYSKGGQTMDL